VNTPFLIRPLEIADVPAALAIICDGRRGYGLESRVAALLEPADVALHQTYKIPRSCYFVVLQHDAIVGGAGIAPLADSASELCELQRMYLRAAVRGCGIGSALLSRCLIAAQAFGFSHCYAETISEMRGALAFYMKHGFKRLSAPLGSSGHEHNDCWLLRPVESSGAVLQCD
jgi:putative acetyltransferase